MARLLTLTPNKTYASEANAVKAVEKHNFRDSDNLTYFIQSVRKGGSGTDAEDRRYFPVFVGERALHAMVHFHFNVVA
jgi:hypothetical protein